VSASRKFGKPKTKTKKTSGKSIKRAISSGSIKMGGGTIQVGERTMRGDGTWTTEPSVKEREAVARKKRRLANAKAKRARKVNRGR
jgi:hypothetical protein